MLITTLRSRPCGRSGLAEGSSPAAMRSVQSANSVKAFFGPSRLRLKAIFAFACPDCTRLLQASTELPAEANSLGTVRMPLEPSAWQDWQEFLIVSIQ